MADGEEKRNTKSFKIILKRILKAIFIIFFCIVVSVLSKIIWDYCYDKELMNTNISEFVKKYDDAEISGMELTRILYLFMENKYPVAIYFIDDNEKSQDYYDLKEFEDYIKKVLKSAKIQNKYIISFISYNDEKHIDKLYIYDKEAEEYVNSPLECSDFSKPIIYLYPEEKESVNIWLGNPEQLTHTYPKYDERAGWNVTAEPNGNLLYGDKNLYALYWEGKSRFDNKIQDDGFIVKGEKTIEFLEEKLSILGLNEREAEEFIVYWLPQMEDNKYNYIRFETSNEIEENMPLNISPKPDTTIRIMMDWCEINSESEANRLSHNIKEQELTTPERAGFVAVEWGGSRIK